jgi:nucleoside-diphosphate-sugar epimerase
MRLLILGGTWFLGRTLAEQAISRGWDVTCFNRGRTGRDVPEVTSIRGDRTDPGGVAGLAAAGQGAGRWDAVVDTSAYEPPDALDMARTLKPVADRYVLVSTVSVYEDWPAKPVDETSRRWPKREGQRRADPEIAALPGPVAYGTLKASCERAIESVYGDEAFIVRPGVVLGPYEYVGRLPVLLRRAERGGPMLAAGDPARPIQPVDVRDLSTFILDQIDAQVGGVLNVTAPTGHATYGDLLQTCAAVTGADAELVWADMDWLEQRGVQQWTQMPLWRTSPGTWAVDSTAAAAAGLTCRPLQETVADTWAWLQGEEPVPHERQAEHGLPVEREAELLAEWRQAIAGQGAATSTPR